MKINKLYIGILIAATSLFVACDEYEDTETKSPTVSASNPAVRFANDNAATYEIEPTVTGIDITVIRTGSTAALEVPITVVANTESSFIVPSTLSFAAGEDTVTLTVAIDYTKAPLGEELSLGVKVGDVNANPYLVEYGEYYATVTILNWQKYAVGTYYSNPFDQSWTQDLYRAEGTDKYRFFSLYANGYNFTFTWDGGNALGFDYDTDADGYYLYQTGFVYSTYGMFVIHIDSSSDWTYYTASTDKFVFDGKWIAGTTSFGWFDDTYTITSRY